MPFRAVLDTLQLSSFADLAFSPEYGILIGDPFELMIWHISPDGRTDFIHAPGQGPGEYRGIRALAWGPGGKIHIAGNSRVVVYSHLLEYESWLRSLTAWDIAVTEDGLVYAATTIHNDGPVVRIDPTTNTRLSVTQWRDSNEIMGIPNNRMASKALLQWNGEKGLLYIGYTADARFEVVHDSDVIRSFILPSETVEKSLSMMKKEMRKSGSSLAFIETMHSFCFVDENTILTSLGDELILATLEGEVIKCVPRPPHFRQIYSGPRDCLIAMNYETMRIELLLLNELFPDIN